MKVSYNKEQNCYTLHQINQLQMELIGIAMANENQRLMMLGQLNDQQFKELLLTDAEFLNAAAREKAVDIEAFKAELEDENQLAELRSKTGLGKNCKAMQKLFTEFIEGQQKLLHNINFDVSI